jgi:chemosensory pili system protein ChpA (sensor histidine kinase/response regulator)
MPSHIHPETAAGFLDEIQSQISAIRQGASILKDNPSDFAAFEQVHRFLFGIKTSAMLAGLTTLSHIAHYQAVALEEIASGLLQWTPLTTMAFEIAVAQMDAYVSASSPASVDGRAMLGQVVRAFREMRGIPQDCADEEIDALDNLPNENNEQPARQQELPPGRGWEFDTLPADLIETFQQEAGQHMAAIGGALQLLDHATSAKPALEGLLRSVHTLRGAATSVGLHQLGALAGRLERLIENLEDDSYPLPANLQNLLQSTFGALGDLAAGRNDAIDLQARTAQLHASIEEMDGILASRGAEDSACYTAATAGWEKDSLSSDLAEIFQEEASELLSAMDLALAELAAGPVTTEEIGAARRPVHTLKGAAGSVGLKQASRLASRMQLLLDGMEEHEIETSAVNLALLRDAFPVLRELCNANNRPASLRRKVEALHARFDSATAKPPAQDLLEPISADLAEIFRLEAEELLVRIGESLRSLQSAPGEVKPLDDLRRDVHTLKGAAASVGLRQFGHLAHRMEDLFDSWSGEVKPGPEAHRLLRDTIDAMTATASGSNPDAASALLLRYGQMLDGAAARPAPSGPTMPAETVSPSQAARKKSGLTVRVPIERLDEMARTIGELMVNRSAFESQLAAYAKEVGELQLSLARLKRISNRLDSDFEVSSFQAGYGQLAVRAVHSSTLAKDGREEFDALEFDRYTDFHLVSRDLNETSSDIGTAANELSYRKAHFDSYLSRLGTLTSEIQDKIMRIRMVPLQSIAARLERTARTACDRCGKVAALVLDGAQVELDKSVLEEIAGPLDHIVRNAVDHGIEGAELRRALGKPEQGAVRIAAFNQGTQVVIEVTDDGAGLQLDRLRETAIRKGLRTAEQLDAMTAGELHELIFQPGFSTARGVSEISGRGVGMDVVRAAVNKLRGTIAIESEPGIGTKFIVRLPMSLAVLRVLLVEANGETLAIPLASIHQVLRVDSSQLAFDGPSPTIRAGEKDIPVYRLGDVLRLAGPPARNSGRIPVLVFNFGERPVAFAVDQLGEARDVVVKSLGGLLRRVPGISGATLLGDGSVVLIVEPADIVRLSGQTKTKKPVAALKPRGYDVMVVDDSVSVRRVLSNLIVNNSWTCTPAKDGVEALEILRSRGSAPDVILLDIEMPRMDGYDLTGIIRNDPVFKHMPIVMLTSRSGDKHRRKAFEVGATEYLVKPYLEETLLAAIRKVVTESKQTSTSSP